MTKANGDSAPVQVGNGRGGNASEVEPDGPNLDIMSKTLFGIQDQIKFADSKATFIAGLNVLLFGFVVSNADRLAATAPATRAWAFYTACILLILYGLAALVSIVHVILTVMSRFGDLAPNSHTHFAHILKTYGKDYTKYCTVVQAMTACDWATDIGTQIVEVSHIAKTKHLYARRAAMWTLGALGFWVAGLIAVIAAR